MILSMNLDTERSDDWWILSRTAAGLAGVVGYSYWDLRRRRRGYNYRDDIEFTRATLRQYATDEFGRAHLADFNRRYPN